MTNEIINRYLSLFPPEKQSGMREIFSAMVEEIKDSTTKNLRKCHCCGQMRPYPTEPGEWEYCENPTMDNPVWLKVSVKLPEPDDREGMVGMAGLRLWRDGEMIWWPCNYAWRKL